MGNKRNKVFQPLAPAPPAKPLRQYCEEIDVVCFIRTVNERGQAVDVKVSNPMKLLRANTPDVWAHIDQLVANMKEGGK